MSQYYDSELACVGNYGKYFGKKSKVIWLPFTQHPRPGTAEQNNISPEKPGQTSCKIANKHLNPGHSLQRRIPRTKCVLSEPSAASVCRGPGGGLQGPPGHLQGSFLGLVPANKASGVNEDAALNPAELRQRFVPDAAPLLGQGQPGAGGETEGASWLTDGHCLDSCSLW